MRYFELGKTGITVPAVALGCMRINRLDKKEAERLVKTALAQGINFFDHADIYGGGVCESHFSESIGLTPSMREKMILQTKCGIRPDKGTFDFSKEHILDSVNNSLKRLNTDYIDILLLHRPDTLMEPEEVAEAFALLKASGKVRHFGVSNQNPVQIALLKKYLHTDIAANQLQLSITNCPMIDSGLNVNMNNEPSVMHEGGVLEYCRLHDITIQAWSPFQYGFFEGVFVDNEKYEELNEVMARIADENHVTKNAVAVAWIMRHPARIQTIVGTTNAQRLTEICQAADFTLTREEWYELYKATGKKLP